MELLSGEVQLTNEMLPVRIQTALSLSELLNSRQDWGLKSCTRVPLTNTVQASRKLNARRKKMMTVDLLVSQRWYHLRLCSAS